MNNIDTLLHAFRSQDPGSPRLTWYGPDSERIELSGKVLDNWVAKTANFLTEEFDVGPGTSSALELPAHWKSLVIALAALACGSTAQFIAPANEGARTGSSETSVWFVTEEAQLANAQDQADVVAVALPALAMAWPSDLPDGVYDFAAEVRMFADAFNRFDDPGPGQPALRSEAETYSFAELSGFASTAEKLAGNRIALFASAGLAKTAVAALGIWLAGGSIVLFSDETLATEKTLASEQVTNQK
ncbi:TIGR03089 family protein [Renibacterium salmoninarum]|nr:TIGR03089 family protein [Renibacterium salmoninarum]